jgi:putative intracellular protease/amidase
MNQKILIVTGDGGESYEALYAVHRFAEEGIPTVVAAPRKGPLHWLFMTLNQVGTPTLKGRLLL